ncbi:MAG: ROK family transcriptional regulator [Clostridia bacterium]|nr:ROK family transcriptional regulator [Clostridia bacterium]
MNLLLKTKIVNLIRIYGPISRTSIAEKLDISMTAVTNYVSQLLHENLIEEVGTQESTGGRKAILLKIKKNYGYIIAIDFGQKYFRISLGDMEGNIIHKEKIESKSLGKSKEGMAKIISMVENVLNSYLPNGKALIGIGVGVSGIVDYNNGVCLTIANLPGWDNVCFKDILEKEFSVPVFVDDSSRLHALAESKETVGRKRNLIFVGIGIGIGLGIIIDWKLFRGVNGLAGELGHIIVEENGYQCGCGNKGCLEQYVAVPSIIRRVKGSLENGISSVMSQYIKDDFDAITPEIVSRAVSEGDKLAFSIIIEAGRYLGVGLSELITLFNPSLIIIGGGGANISDEIINEAKRTIHIRTINQSARSAKIIKSTYGEDGALKGAMMLTLDNFFDLNKLIDESIFML